MVWKRENIQWAAVGVDEKHLVMSEVDENGQTG